MRDSNARRSVPSAPSASGPGLAGSGLLSEPLLNSDEASRLLRVPRSTLYELVRSCHLPHVRVGRGLRFTRGDLAIWVRENTFR